LQFREPGKQKTRGQERFPAAGGIKLFMRPLFQAELLLPQTNRAERLAANEPPAQMFF
jgi:hypothetical protein